MTTDPKPMNEILKEYQRETITLLIAYLIRCKELDPNVDILHEVIAFQDII